MLENRSPRSQLNPSPVCWIVPNGKLMNGRMRPARLLRMVPPKEQTFGNLVKLATESEFTQENHVRPNIVSEPARHLQGVCPYNAEEGIGQAIVEKKMAKTLIGARRANVACVSVIPEMPPVFVHNNRVRITENYGCRSLENVNASFHKFWSAYVIVGCPLKILAPR